MPAGGLECLRPRPDNFLRDETLQRSIRCKGAPVTSNGERAINGFVYADGIPLSALCKSLTRPRTSAAGTVNRRASP